MKRFYVTTPIYYVNDNPHIGHAYTTVIADVFARYYRQKLGVDNVFFLTGTDEHGAKVAQAASKKGLNPQEFVDEISNHYQETWRQLNISHDYFIRTTHPEHRRIVQELLQKLYDKGYIYKAKYKGVYCIGCEKYLNGEEIINGKCVLHPSTDLIEQEEENYFLKLESLVPHVLAALENERYKVLPKERKTEILSKMHEGVHDISISRTGIEWGIPLPWDTTHTVYVWVDALFNYYSATKINPHAARFWPADLHLMAKDILWFHALIWEALLLALEEDLPRTIFAHGFFTIEGQKMSKSLGNVINPLDLIKVYGVDGLRYLLISSFAFGNDGDFALARFEETYNADLANGIGNLVSRIAKLCEKSNHDFSGIVNNRRSSFNEKIDDAIANFRPDEALRFIRNDVQSLDKQIHEDAPWILGDTELIQVLESYIPKVLALASDLKPFLPETAEKIEVIFNTGKISKPEPLFRRIPPRV